MYFSDSLIVIMFRGFQHYVVLVLVLGVIDVSQKCLVWNVDFVCNVFCSMSCIFVPCHVFLLSVVVYVFFVMPAPSLCRLPL